MAFSFFGGIHPKENKWYAEKEPIQIFPEPDELVVPMQQHIGPPCEPLVKKGDPVLAGQKIGQPKGLGAPIHSPVSGTVTRVEMRPHTSGTMAMSVVIQNDHRQALSPEIQPRTEAQVEALTVQELMQIIQEAGIVGMGGAAFPTHVKLASGLGKVDTVIVNLSECEPYIVADDRLAQEYPEQILSGLGIILKILGLKKACIAIENNKPLAAEALRSHISGEITLELLPAKYPQGAEKQLIKAITGRQVPSGGLPAEVGCGVFNAATCKAIYDAVYEGRPLTHRVVTVSGDIVMEPKNLLVPVGTSFNALLEAVGHSENPYKVLSGGPMMGVAQYDLLVPVIKGTNAVTILGSKNKYVVENSRCIRCGRCVEVCPMHLMPVLMYKAMFTGDAQEMKALDMLDCMECGCCAYVCPAGVPLVLGFRAGKQQIRDAQQRERG